MSFCPYNFVLFVSFFAVALNYQTPDKQNLYNRAQFRDNGGCGFVLKPHFLVSPSSRYSPLSPSAPLNRPFRPWRIELRILGGRYLPKPKATKNQRLRAKVQAHTIHVKDVLDPYVKVSCIWGARRQKGMT